jgi:hypothetical protein
VTLVSVGSMYWPPIPPHFGNVGPNVTGAALLDAAGEKYAAVLRVPKTGSIARVRFRTGTVTIGDTLRVSLQSVLSASGNPSEVIDQFRDVTILDANDNTAFLTGLITSDGTDTGALRNVVRGDYLAVVIEYASYVAGNLNIAMQTGSSGTHVFPYVNLKAAGSWTKPGVSVPLHAIEYDDASYPFIPDVVPAVSGISVETFLSTTNPDERGNRLELPFSCTSSGVWWFGYTAGSGDLSLKLYNGAGVLLRTQPVDQDIFTTNVAHSPVKLLWNEGPIDLTPGTYRLVHQATNAANGSIYQWSVPAAEALAAMEAGQLAYSTTRNDLGAWTDSMLKFYGEGLILSHVHATGGGRRPRMGRAA